MARIRVAVIRWGFATIAALVATGSIAHALRASRSTNASEGRRIHICVAAHDLHLGETLRADACRLTSVRTHSVPRDVLRAPAALETRVTRVPMVAGTPITERHLTDRDRNGLDGVAPPGMRIVQIAVADDFEPPGGTRVDVIATFTPDGSKPSVAVVVRNARTVGVGRRERSTTKTSIQLIVSPEQAQRLALAQANGTLRIAVAPPEGGRSPTTE